MVRNVVDAVGQIRICEDPVNHLARIAVVELILGSHPLRRGPIFWAETIVMHCVCLPWCAAKFDCIDRRVKIIVIKYRRSIIVRDQRCTPETEEIVNSVV